MPYFIYRVSESRKLEYIDRKEKYREARDMVRDLRSQNDQAGVDSVRMIFAKSQAEAEKLLSAPRDDRVIGED